MEDNNLSDAKKIAKAMQKVLDNKSIMAEVYSNSIVLDDVNRALGAILAYFISTRKKDLPIDSKTKKPIIFFNNEQLEQYIYNKTKQNSKLIDKIRHKTIENGFVTHSTNGCNLAEIKKHGLGTDERTDVEQEEKDFNILENALGKNEFLHLQPTTKSAFYYTFPGAKSFYYAAEQSPERLFNGPLSNSRPIVMGETKAQHYEAVVNDKLKNLQASNKQEVIDSSKRLIDKYCTKRPVIALIPINSKNYSLTANHAVQREDSKKLIDFLKESNGEYNPDRPLSAFTCETNEAEQNNLGNFVSVGSSISPKEIAFINVPDKIEIIQQLALCRDGKQLGEEIYVKKEKKTSIKPLSKLKIRKIEKEHAKKQIIKKMTDKISSNQILKNDQNNENML